MNMKVLNVLDVVLKPFRLKMVYASPPGETFVPDCYGRAHSTSDPLCTGGGGYCRCDYYKACEARTKTYHAGLLRTAP
jgi:hypothetical protein